MADAFNLTVDDQGIAHLCFDLPDEKVNKLSIDTISELSTVIDDIENRGGIKALVFTSGKNNNFIAGLDLKQFDVFVRDHSVANELLHIGHSTFRKIEQLPFPTIVVINGACLGGGLELALAFKYRLVVDHPKVQLGLPETTLGIVPGWGGTMRLPRLIGLQQGLKMILSGKSVDAKKAYKLKLADGIITIYNTENEINQFVGRCLNPKEKQKIHKHRQHRGLRTALLEKNPLGRWIVFNAAKKSVLKKTKGFYPAPIAAIDIIKASYSLKYEDAVIKDPQVVIEKMPKAFIYAENLVNLFFIREELLKDSGVIGNIKPREIHHGAVIGAGTMGSGIAWLLSYRNVKTRMKDINWDMLNIGYKHINTIYGQLAKIKHMKRAAVMEQLSNLTTTTDYSGFSKKELIIEAAVEDLELKWKIFGELEAIVPKNTIIATNTSSLSVNEMAKKFKYPERFVGMHFFNPVNRMPLVEIVSGDKTSPEVIATAVDFIKKMKKTPVVVRDCQGFLVNRIFIAGFLELLYLLEEHVDMKRMDQLMLKFGMPMGPFYLADLIGNDVNHHIMPSFHKAYGDRMTPPEILQLMFKNNLLGIKSGKGFYIHKGKKSHPNPEVNKLIASLSKKTLIISDEEILHRVVYQMINEAARCLDEKIVANPGYLDMALVMGTGFPPFRGGLLRHADTIGVGSITDSLENLAKKFGDRFQPCDYLTSLREKDKKFYSKPT